MTNYQLLDDVSKKEFITIVHHSLLYDNDTYKKIMDIISKSKPERPIVLFPKSQQHEN
jgi:hypothetical protein